MAISKRGIFESPSKGPYSFERYDSDLERKMMVRLESDPEVSKWQKRHGISIPWIDSHGRRCNYRPDFLVEYSDGQKLLIEVKNPALFDSPAVLRKRSAAQEWCRRRGMTYELATIHDPGRG